MCRSFMTKCWHLSWGSKMKGGTKDTLCRRQSKPETAGRTAKEEGGIAFAMYPTSVEDLMQIADEGKLMPPKSTWFEPKLRSGIFIHKLKD